MTTIQESTESVQVITLGHTDHMTSLVIDMNNGRQYHYKWGI